jgi:hypothetical protein
MMMNGLDFLIIFFLHIIVAWLAVVTLTSTWP